MAKNHPPLRSESEKQPSLMSGPKILVVENAKDAADSKSVEPTVGYFEHLGIKQLSPGISIFRFSHFYIKKLSPLARGKHSTSESVLE